jgi:hypothetical protein
MIRHCADVQSTPSLTSIKSEPATAITANDRSWQIVLKNSSNTQRSSDLSNIVSTHRELHYFVNNEGTSTNQYFFPQQASDFFNTIGTEEMID